MSNFIYLDKSPKEHVCNLYPRKSNAQKVNKTSVGIEEKIASHSEYQKNQNLLRGQRKIIDAQDTMSTITEQHLADSRNITLYHAGKFNETPKSSVSTDTEVYYINYHNIHHAPHSSIDESVASDNDGYDTEKHVRVIRQVSSDTYCSDNCFYSDSETNKFPDIITHDNTTSNILYEMCDTLNKVPDILSGNLDSNSHQKETPCRYSGTSSSSFFSDDTSPNWSPNSNLQFKQWPEMRNDTENIGNDMTDTDSIIYHNVEDAHVVGDDISSYDNVSRRSLNFLNSTIDLFNSKPCKLKESPIIRDNINVKNNQILEYPENIISNEKVLPEKSEPQNPKKFINLDVLNKLHLGQMDQDIDHEISTLLDTEGSRKINEPSSKVEKNKSNFYEYDPRHLKGSNVLKSLGTREINQCEVMNKLEHQPPKNNSPNFLNNGTNYSLHILHSDESNCENYHKRTESYKKTMNKDYENKHLSKKRKKCDENINMNFVYFSEENLKSYVLSESSSAPNIFGRNKKYRLSTSSIDEGSDYDPELSFHKFSKSISNVSLHEYGKKVLREKQNRNSREELEKIEKTVGKMLEQVKLHENLLQNDLNYMEFSLTQQEKKALPLLFNLHASHDRITQSLDEVPINCNRKPLRYKYQTKNDLNIRSSSNVSSACSIEDLERSVNKLLSDVKQEESKLISSQLDEYHQFSKMKRPKEVITKFTETEMPCRSSAHNMNSSLIVGNRRKKCDTKNNETNVSYQIKPSTSHQNNHFLCNLHNIYSKTNENEPSRTPNDPYNKCDLKNKEDVWWEGAYQFCPHKDFTESRRKIKRSNKRASYWPNNPYGLDRQISYTPSSEEGFSSSSNSESECSVLDKVKKKGVISLNVKNLYNGKVGIEIETADVLKTQQYPNNSLSSLWNRSMPSLPSVGSESSFPSALSIRSSESEDCLSNLGYYQNLAIPPNCIEYITPADIGLSDTLINSGYCHWNFHDNEGKERSSSTYRILF